MLGGKEFLIWRWRTGGTKGAPGGGGMTARASAIHRKRARLKSGSRAAAAAKKKKKIVFVAFGVTARGREGEIVRKYFGGEPLPVWGKFLREEGAN